MSKLEPTAEGVPADAMRRLAELEPGKPGSIFTFLPMFENTAPIRWWAM